MNSYVDSVKRSAHSASRQLEAWMLGGSEKLVGKEVKVLGEATRLKNYDGV